MGYKYAVTILVALCLIVQAVSDEQLLHQLGNEANDGVAITAMNVNWLLAAKQDDCIER